MLNYDEYEYTCDADRRLWSTDIGNIGCTCIVICIVAIFIHLITGIFSQQLKAIVSGTYLSYLSISLTYFRNILVSLDKIYKDKKQKFPYRLLTFINVVVDISLFILLLIYLNVVQINNLYYIIDNFAVVIISVWVLLIVTYSVITFLRFIINTSKRLEEESEKISKKKV